MTLPSDKHGRVDALLDKQIAFLEAQPKGQSYEAQFKIALQAYREMTELAKEMQSDLDTPLSSIGAKPGETPRTDQLRCQHIDAPDTTDLYEEMALHAESLERELGTSMRLGAAALRVSKENHDKYMAVSATRDSPMPKLNATINAAQGMANTGATAMHIIELFRALASEWAAVEVLNRADDGAKT